MAELLRVEPDEESAGAVVTVRLDRPPMNVLNEALQDELRRTAEDLAADTTVRAVVLYGGERVFAAGADVKEFQRMDRVAMAARAGALTGSLDALARLPKPVVAAVTGYALGGGCELALTADWRISADDAKWGQPEILLGIIPGAGATQRLPRLIGAARAKELIFTGRFVPADEALAMGLANQVVPAAEVYPAALAWARQFRDGPALALAAAKRAVDTGADLDIAAGLGMESELFSGLFDSKDKDIGLTSFLERGPGHAHFVGR
jgi:enoyl-CoA hydratase/carnithine racemase